MEEDKIKNIVKKGIYKIKSKLMSSEDREIIDKFHKIYYDLGIYQFTEWEGVRIYKYPSDLFLYSEIIFKNKPDVIIETGTLFGGSALYMARLLDILGNGKVISIDIVKKKFPKHPRIEYITSNSTDPKLIEHLKEDCKNKKIMVILDSDHRKMHVLKEMQLYSELVSSGQYMVVEDGCINNHPVYPSFGEGPYESIMDFISKNKGFVIDKKLEHKFLFTQNTKGYLLKVE